MCYETSSRFDATASKHLYLPRIGLHKNEIQCNGRTSRQNCHACIYPRFAIALRGKNALVVDR